MSGTDSRHLVVGIDAGGTRCRACLAAVGPGGARTVLGRGSGGPGNAMSVGRADLTRHLTEAVGGAVRAARAADPRIATRVVASFGGFAGGAAGLGPERGKDLAVSCLRDALAAHGITGVPVGAGGDIEVALAAGPGAPRDGLVLIAGTGAIAARLAAGGRRMVSDGHGWLLGDEGSGFWLGNRATRAALEALDGRGPWTALVPRVTAHYLGEDVAAEVAGGDAPGRLDGPARHRIAEAVVAAAYEQAPARLAAVSPIVVAVAAEGDAVALGLLDAAADLLAGTVGSLRPLAGEPVVATGGLLAPAGPLLERVSGRLARQGLRVFPVADPSEGAAALALTLLLDGAG
ncbi:N-acetylglucosamine kinase [Actinacidiphila guanduensis]|uniref:BadF-type ATPase n=1 Tax=Actinacidiphila guanduensis TaxID=310781 RepID=A0A1H0DYQ4_9ACTN|nr:BadF/BadG/BcrA/BcrD ATPase family protein [Actinacidiphila guanduensis]SDN75101.1 BadF-type ATPase [Actinacidiphila guanduensis]